MPSVVQLLKSQTQNGTVGPFAWGLRANPAALGIANTDKNFIPNTIDSGFASIPDMPCDFYFQLTGVLGAGGFVAQLLFSDDGLNFVAGNPDISINALGWTAKHTIKFTWMQVLVSGVDGSTNVNLYSSN